MEGVNPPKSHKLLSEFIVPNQIENMKLVISYHFLKVRLHMRIRTFILFLSISRLLSLMFTVTATIILFFRYQDSLRQIQIVDHTLGMT